MTSTTMKGLTITVWEHTYDYRAEDDKSAAAGCPGCAGCPDCQGVRA